MTQTPGGSLAIVDIPERCGNAPRKEVVRDMTVALYRRDPGELLPYLSDRIRWSVIGETTLEGTDEVAHWLSNEPAPRQLKINTVITHGWECGVDGSVVFPDGTAYAFSHMVFFTGASKTARVKEVRTYRVPTTVV